MTGTEHLVKVGEGKGSKVYIDHLPDGTPFARKIFGANTVITLSNYILSGAPGDYIWHEHALAAALYRNDMVSMVQAGLLLFWGGSIMRTAYTSCRMAYSITTNPRPTNVVKTIKDRGLALALGAIPGWGNFAYPAQMAISGTKADAEIGKFMTYYHAAKVGEKVPLYGGKDTQTEHFFNRMPNLLFRNRASLGST